MASRSSRAFTAVVRKTGVSPYVEVPAAVSRAFAAHARAGRIRTAGTLEGVSIRATLVPVAGGRHRLYVHGGMRSAAGVDVGDRVRLVLRPLAADQVTVPRDLAAALRSTRRARSAFDALAASHRRSLVRFVDDARTVATRARRIERTVEHVLDPSRPFTGRATRESASGRLWTCPRCGNAFVNRNQWHSCRRHDLDAPFAGKPPEIRALFDRFRDMVEACGPVRLQPYRDHVAFMVRVRFAGATPRARWLDLGFWLTRRVESPRFHRIETLYPGVHVHRLRVTRPDQLDAELGRWIRESYAVGCRKHLVKR
jgi:hypothetical protein